MFRLVLIHQLVLSLLVGPMLCCCTATRLGLDAGSVSKSASSTVKPERRSCCGTQKSDGQAQKAPGHKPGDPTKCPCKDGSGKTITVPEVTSAQVDSITQFASPLAALDVPLSLVVVADASRSGQRFDHTSSSLSTSDILFAHHKLRC